MSVSSRKESRFAKKSELVRYGMQTRTVRVQVPTKAVPLGAVSLPTKKEISSNPDLRALVVPVDVSYAQPILKISARDALPIVGRLSVCDTPSRNS
jgi:hypothetical protein